MTDWNRKKTGYLIVSFISVLFTHLFFSVRNMYSDLPFLYIDHAYFLADSKYFAEEIIPVFQASYGYYANLYCGFEFFPLYPDGLSIFVFLISSFGFSIEISYKIALFITMFCFGITPYIFLTRLNFKPWIGVISNLWFWIGLYSFWLFRFHVGSLPFLIASVFAMYFLLDSIEIFKYQLSKNIGSFELKSKSDLFFKKFLVKDVLFLSGSIIFNFYATFFIALVLSLYFIYMYFSHSKKQIFIKIFSFYAKVIFVSFLLLSYWLIPALLTSFPNSVLRSDFYLYTYGRSIEFNTEYLHNNSAPLIGVILMLILSVISYRKQNRAGKNQNIYQLVMYMLIFITSIFLVFLMPFFQISLFQGINAYKYLIFSEYSFVVIFALFLSVLERRILEIKSHVGKPMLKQIFSRKDGKNMFIILILIVPNLFMFSDVLFFQKAQYSFREPLLGQAHNQNYTLWQSDLDYNGWELPEKTLISWLSENTTKDSRILFQNSGDLSDFKFQGHSIIYISQITDRFFATGHTSEVSFRYSNETNFIDDNLYGKPIAQYNLSTILPFFLLYNIEYVVVWSNIATDFFSDLSSIGGSFSKVIELYDYSIFRYLDAPRSFVSGNETNFHVKDNLIQFNLEQDSISENNTLITLSFHDYINWHVSVNDVEVEKVPHPLGLIQFYLPTEGSFFEVKVEWKRTPIENISNMLSTITILLGVFVIIANYLKKNKGV